MDKVIRSVAVLPEYYLSFKKLKELDGKKYKSFSSFVNTCMAVYFLSVAAQVAQVEEKIDSSAAPTAVV